MYWLDEVNDKLKRKNQILFSRNSEILQDLALLLEQQTHQAIVLWALELAEETVRVLDKKYPNDSRPKNAAAAARLWAEGKIKMPAAKKEILSCHAMAKELSPREDAALCRAVGQACSTVHTAGHAIGYPVYELTALVRKYGVSGCREPVEARNRQYIARLIFWQNNYKNYGGEWAPFMLRQSR